MRTIEQKKEYHRNYARKYYHLNKEKIQYQRNIWLKTNKERDLERFKRYRRRHPDRLRNQSLKRLYGITLEDYNRMLLEQSGLCAVCELPNYRQGRLMVDHCHTTKAVRGLLCDTCNKALGFFKDDAVLLKRALSYLKKYE